MHRLLSFLMACTLAFAPTSAFAWGQMGHAIIAEIAQRRLSPQAAREVERLLGRGHSLSSIASWADGVAHSNTATARWHFVNIPLNDETYDEARDCAQMAGGDCIIAELARLRTEIHCAPTATERAEALRFAVHLIGDLHQPLHTVLEGGGANANKVAIRFNGVTCSDHCELNDVKLHAVWDELIISRTHYDWGAYVDHLEQGWLTMPEANAARAGDVTSWMLESHAIARQIWVPDGGTLDDYYYRTAVPIIDRQLGRAGVRLAVYLNAAFSSACPARAH